MQRTFIKMYFCLFLSFLLCLGQHIASLEASEIINREISEDKRIIYEICPSANKTFIFGAINIVQNETDLIFVPRCNETKYFVISTRGHDITESPNNNLINLNALKIFNNEKINGIIKKILELIKTALKCLKDILKAFEEICDKIKNSLNKVIKKAMMYIELLTDICEKDKKTEEDLLIVEIICKKFAKELQTFCDEVLDLFFNLLQKVMKEVIPKIRDMKINILKLLIELLKEIEAGYLEMLQDLMKKLEAQIGSYDVAKWNVPFPVTDVQPPNGHNCFSTTTGTSMADTTTTIPLLPTTSTSINESYTTTNGTSMADTTTTRPLLPKTSTSIDESYTTTNGTSMADTTTTIPLLPTTSASIDESYTTTNGTSMADTTTTRPLLPTTSASIDESYTTTNGTSMADTTTTTLPLLPKTSTSINESHPITAGTTISPCSTNTGIPCVFPYFYKGIKYDKCTNVDYNKFWCPTSLDKSGNVLGYGVCNANSTCQYHKNPENKRCETMGGWPCNFPFEYNLKVYHKCTDVGNGGVKWCAITKDKNTQEAKGWGNCNMITCQ